MWHVDVISPQGHDGDGLAPWMCQVEGRDGARRGFRYPHPSGSVRGQADWSRVGREIDPARGPGLERSAPELTGNKAHHHVVVVARDPQSPAAVECQGLGRVGPESTYAKCHRGPK